MTGVRGADGAGDQPLRTALRPSGSGAARPVDVGAGVVGAADVRQLRDELATMILPGATDTPGSATAQAQAEWVDLIGELEAVRAP